MGDPGFDAVLIPEYGSKLKSIISMFGYYDVYAPEVKFLGTSIWESSSLNKESMIINSWYPTLSRYQSAYFSNKYSNLFGERPNSLYRLPMMRCIGFGTVKISGQRRFELCHYQS